MQIQKPSINGIIRSRNEPSRIRAQKQGQGSDLIRLRHSPDWLRLRKLLQHVLFVPGIVFADEAVDKWRMHASRRDAVAADIVSDVIPRDRVSHRQHCAFAH